MSKMIVLLILVGVLSLTLTGCKQGEVPETGEVNGGAATDTQMDQFLTERGITLPAGVERTNLTGDEGSGIATREVSAEKQTYAVIVDLPSITSGGYVAWLKNSDGVVVNLGDLSYEKGGFMLEKITSEDWSGYTQVVVSQEMGAATAPTTVKLTGSF